MNTFNVKQDIWNEKPFLIESHEINFTRFKNQIDDIGQLHEVVHIRVGNDPESV